MIRRLKLRRTPCGCSCQMINLGSSTSIHTWLLFFSQQLVSFVRQQRLQKWGSPVLNLDYLLHNVVEQQRPLDWDRFWKNQATQVFQGRVLRTGLFRTSVGSTLPPSMVERGALPSSSQYIHNNTPTSFLCIGL